MTNRSTTVNPDKLGAATDRVVAVIRQLLPDERQALADELGAALGDLFAELIGRATSMSASIIGPTLRTVEDLEKRERRRSEKLTHTQAELDARIDAIYAHMPPDLSKAVHQIAVDVEQLKARQAGGDATEQ